MAGGVAVLRVDFLPREEFPTANIPSNNSSLKNGALSTKQDGATDRDSHVTDTRDEFSKHMTI